MIEFIQDPDSQIHVNIFRIERGKQDAHGAKVEEVVGCQLSVG
jgi:hypothetical protein